MDNVTGGSATRSPSTVNRGTCRAYPARFLVSAGAVARAGEHALGRRAQPTVAGAPVRAAEQSLGDGRTDQRSGCRYSGAIGRDGCKLSRNSAPRQPRPGVSRTMSSPARWCSKAAPKSTNMWAVTATGCGQRKVAAPVRAPVAPGKSASVPPAAVSPPLKTRRLSPRLSKSSRPCRKNFPPRSRTIAAAGGDRRPLAVPRELGAGQGRPAAPTVFGRGTRARVRALGCA